MALTLSLCSAAAAATSQYDPSARDFHSSAGGWSGNSESSGVCVPVVLCPVVDNRWVPRGGADGGGDGYITTAIGSVAGVGGEVRGIWQSPPFAYYGAAGENPSSLSFALDRRADVGALLNVTGTSADYTVEVVDQRSARAVVATPVSSQDLGHVPDWSAVGPVALAPESLAIGHIYRIRITSRFGFGAAVAPASHADYDNVGLTASNSSGGGGSSTYPTGSGTAAAVAAGVSANTAVLIGKRLWIRVKCGRRYKSAKRCRVGAQAVTKKRHGKPMTRRARKRVRAGKSKLVALRVKPRYLPKLRKARRVLVKERVIARGFRSKHFVKRLKLKHG